MQCELCTDFGTSQTDIKKLESTTGKTKRPGWGTYKQMVSDDLLFHLFPNFSLLPYGLKNTRLNKIYVSNRKSSPSEGNSIPVWRNTIVHLLLDTMADSSLSFTILTNNTYSNTSPHVVVPFLLVPLH